MFSGTLDLAMVGLPTTFDNTFGAVTIGAFVATVLYGIAIVQTYMYMQRALDEMITLRLSIWFLSLFNTMHLICIIHTLYFYMVTNFANPLVLAQPVPWSLPLVIFFTSTSNVLVQGWFIFRVWRLSKRNRVLTTGLACCSTCSYSISVSITVRFYQLKEFAFYAEANWLVFLGLGLTVFTDLIIALALCYYLRRMRSTIRRTSSMINGLMVYAVNTGLLTSLVCVGCLIARLCQPDNFIFIGLFFPLSSLYSNALLGSLNARDWFRGNKGAVTIPLGSISSGSGSDNKSRAARATLSKDDVEYGAGHQSRLSVKVTTDVVKAAL